MTLNNTDVNEYSSDLSGKTSFKYPKSRNNFQCIGPCYQPNTWIVHPLTLEYITDNINPFCPVKQWDYIDETGKKIPRVTDVCYHPTESKDLSGKEFEMNILTPNIDFNYEQFLKIFYNIHSFEDAIDWIDSKKNNSSLLTRMRIMDCAWHAYGRNVNIIDHRVVEFYIELAKKKWISDIYKKINKYIHIRDSKIMFGNPNDNDLSPNDEIVARTNFLVDRFINNDEMYKFLIRYLKHRKDDWDSIVSHSLHIKDDLIKYIENKINLTIG